MTGRAEPAAIDHVVVLMLENRSFDHLLGFVDHPSPRFDGLLHRVAPTNPGWEGAGPVAATATGKTVLPVDPDHSHDAVMDQLAIAPGSEGPTPTMQGFVESYELKGRGLATAQFGGLLGPLVAWWLRRHSPAPVEGRGDVVMACQPPGNVPVLSTLAVSFGVCTRWFAPVPGETFPNRGFAHAATSDGETNIEYRPYTNRTIFEQLEDAGRTWHIYYDDLPMVSVFVNLWNRSNRLRNWFGFEAFASHVRDGQLPTYAFIEPNHRPPIHTPDRKSGEVSNSQHPGNSIVPADAYDDWDDSSPGDFARAEELIATVYEALRAHPHVFERTLLLITYDEPGGLFDHVPPPRCAPPGGQTAWYRPLQRLLLHRRSRPFDFSQLGPRVPAVVVSPYIAPGTVCDIVRDHASIPATLRRLFAPDTPALTDRDAAAATFDSLLDFASPSPRDDLPDLSAAVPTTRRLATRVSTVTDRAVIPTPYQDLAVVARIVRRRLRLRTTSAWRPLVARPINRPMHAARALTDAAERARRVGRGPTGAVP